MANDKKPKKSATKHVKPFTIKGSFEDVIKVAVTPKEKLQPKEKKD